MFYDKLKLLCKERGISLTHLIGVLGLSSGNLSGWKKGAVPKSDTLAKISDYFGVSSDYLLGREAEKLKQMSQTQEEFDLVSKFVRGSKKKRLLVELLSQLPEDTDVDTLLDMARVYAESKKSKKK